MSKTLVNFFKNRQDLKQMMDKQKNQTEMIKICILYAIEKEKITEESKIRVFTKNASAEYDMFSKSSDPKHRFYTEWGNARKSLELDGRITIKHTFYSNRPVESIEMKSISSFLREIDDPTTVNAGLLRLFQLASEYNISEYNYIFTDLLNIIKSVKLFSDTNIVVNISRILGRINKYLIIQEPKNYENALLLLYDQHIKEICRILRRDKNTKIIEPVILHLFIYTSSEEALYTIFDLIRDLDPDDFRGISYHIGYVLFCTDSILFQKYEPKIDNEIKRLLKSENTDVQQRAKEIYIYRNMRFPRK